MDTNISYELKGFDAEELAKLTKRVTLQVDGTDVKLSELNPGFTEYVVPILKILNGVFASDAYKMVLDILPRENDEAMVTVTLFVNLQDHHLQDVLTDTVPNMGQDQIRPSVFNRALASRILNMFLSPGVSEQIKLIRDRVSTETDTTAIDTLQSKQSQLEGLLSKIHELANSNAPQDIVLMNSLEQIIQAHAAIQINEWLVLITDVAGEGLTEHQLTEFARGNPTLKIDFKAFKLGGLSGMNYLEIINAMWQRGVHTIPALPIAAEQVYDNLKIMSVVDYSAYTRNSYIEGGNITENIEEAISSLMYLARKGVYIYKLSPQLIGKAKSNTGETVPHVNLIPHLSEVVILDPADIDSYLVSKESGNLVWEQNLKSLLSHHERINYTFHQSVTQLLQGLIDDIFELSSGLSDTNTFAEAKAFLLKHNIISRNNFPRNDWKGAFTNDFLQKVRTALVEAYLYSPVTEYSYSRKNRTEEGIRTSPVESTDEGLRRLERSEYKSNTFSVTLEIQHNQSGLLQLGNLDNKISELLHAVEQLVKQFSSQSGLES